ncbi:primosomal replication protein N [Alcanivorax sp. CY1518]|uniref:Primosomal replication protein N n=1 Tax=Alcanivorax quisquiliarum TaxID=2933565 RepID=A0ABT0E6X3_9GAMM|nr:primosomal replication protein N [Alcanivorax quisquiliarum]
MTPAGAPTRRLWLEHRSRQEEGGAPREVQARMAVMLVGEALVSQSRQLAEGQRILVQGFLARAGFRGEARDRLQLHATRFECFD